MPDTARGVPRARGRSGFKGEVDGNDVGWGSTGNCEIFDNVEESTPMMDELWTIMPAALQTCQLDSFQSVLGLCLKDFRSLSARSIPSHHPFLSLMVHFLLQCMPKGCRYPRFQEMFLL